MPETPEHYRDAAPFPGSNVQSQRSTVRTFDLRTGTFDGSARIPPREAFPPRSSKPSTLNRGPDVGRFDSSASLHSSLDELSGGLLRASNGTPHQFHAPVVQVEGFLGANQGVAGSNPARSTILRSKNESEECPSKLGRGEENRNGLRR